MCQDAAVEIAGAQVEKGCEEAKQRRVGQLEERSDYTWQDDGGREDRCEVGLVRSSVCDDVLTEMMQMRKAEDEWRAKNDFSWSGLCRGREPTGSELEGM